MHTAVDVHRGAGRGAGSAVVLDDLGGYEAVGVAEQLAAQGTAVAFVTRFPGAGDALGVTLERDPARQRLARAGVRCFAGYALTAIDASSVQLEPLAGGEPVRWPSELVVLVTRWAAGLRLAT